MIDYEREISDYGRSITGGQLATTAEYALYTYNLQYDQRQELRQMRQQMGQLRAENAQLVEQIENAEAQNEDLQETVDELGLQLQQFQLNQGNNMPVEVNAVEVEEEVPILIQRH